MEPSPATRWPRWRVIATLATIVATGALTVTGWVVSDYLAAGRELENDRRERLIEHLIDNYVHLARMGQNRPFTNAEKQAAEDAITWIQALGTPEQIRVLTRLADDGRMDWTDLLNAIRKDIRELYELPPFEGRIRPFSYPRVPD